MSNKPKPNAKKHQPQRTPQQKYDEIVHALCDDPTVTLGSGKKGFGASALCVGSKIFAFLSSHNDFVVKLPRARVDALVDAGAGQRFDLGHGRLMREWLAISDSSDASAYPWLELANEAKAFVGAKS